MKLLFPLEVSLPNPRVLFVLKQRNGYESSGLSNSVRFVVDMLWADGIEAGSVEVVDNNSIHREVTRYKPTHVVIEALWVVPSKFEILQNLNPNVHWVVRTHSEIPFLAGEGIAIDWCCKCVEMPNVAVAANSAAAVRDMRRIVQAAHPGWSSEQIEAKVLDLPNFYPFHLRLPHGKKPDNFLDVACFGAIRPLKNQLLQAVAATEYAGFVGKTLRFHVNGTRCEQGGDNVQRNLRALFSNTDHQLVEHAWLNHKDFLDTLSEMDMGMQVSFSETFNIVAADMVVSGLPIVTSPEITWVTKWCQAEPTNSEDIVAKMMRANDWRLKMTLRVLNLRGLKHYCEHSKMRWREYLLSR